MHRVLLFCVGKTSLQKQTRNPPVSESFGSLVLRFKVSLFVDCNLDSKVLVSDMQLNWKGTQLSVKLPLYSLESPERVFSCLWPCCILACPSHPVSLPRLTDHPSCGWFTKNQQKKLLVGAWNVHTLLDRENTARPERRTALIAKELAGYRIDIAAQRNMACWWRHTKGRWWWLYLLVAW